MNPINQQSAICNSENNFRRQLHVERLAGSDAWRIARVARVAQKAKRRRARQRRAGIRPVDDVEDVEDFRAELNRRARRELRRLEHRHVDGLEPGTVVRVARQVAERAGGWHGECRRIEVSDRGARRRLR